MLFVEAVQVTAVDTTAAGDTYLAYLVAGQMAGLSNEHACRQASRAAAMAVQKAGATAAIPHKAEIEQD